MLDFLSLGASSCRARLSLHSLLSCLDTRK